MYIKRLRANIFHCDSSKLQTSKYSCSWLYGTWAMHVLNLPTFENKKCTAYDHFHGNSPYGEIPTKKEPITKLGFPSRLPCHIINTCNCHEWCSSTVLFLTASYMKLTGSDSSNSQCSLLSDCTVVHLQLFLARTAHLLWTLNPQTKEKYDNNEKNCLLLICS